MKLVWRLILLFTLGVILSSCRKNPVSPDESNAVPGRRDYTWVADTINNPFIDFYNIWGNSLSNVWTAAVLMSESLYRYDGQKWNLDNRVYISDPVALWGYGNNIWIGNDAGCIWKFTGSSYSQELKDFKVDSNLVDFFQMAGTTNNEIYAVGDCHTNPVIIKYDGTSWKLDKKLPDAGGFNQIIYCSRNDRYYLVADLFDYSCRVFEYDRNNLKLIYTKPPSNANPTISSIDGYPFIVTYNKIYRYFLGYMELILEIDNPNFGDHVWGSNINDIFIRMQDGLAHYNGTDWQYLFSFPEPTWLAANCVIFDKDIFIPAKIQRTGYPIIYHGILK